MIKLQDRCHFAHGKTHFIHSTGTTGLDVSGMKNKFHSRVFHKFLTEPDNAEEIEGTGTVEERKFVLLNFVKYIFPVNSQ
jgi:hypothetical protein